MVKISVRILISIRILHVQHSHLYVHIFTIGCETDGDKITLMTYCYKTVQ